MPNLHGRLKIRTLLGSSEPVHHLPLGVRQDTHENLALRYAVMSRQALELGLGLDRDDHVEALTLTINILQVSLAVGGLACSIALRCY